MKWAAMAVAVVVLLQLLVQLRRASRLVSLEDARRLLKLGGMLLDVRSREAFTASHIPSARNIPMDQLQRRQHELGHGHVVVYSGSAGESAKAARLLRNAGLQKVHDLGAMTRWKPATR